MIAVTNRDADLRDDEPVFNAYRRLAARGDPDAQRILAQYESPVSKAVEYICDEAITHASDWASDERSCWPLKGGREFSQVIEDYLANANFDPMSLLPDKMTIGVNPGALMLELNREIRDAKDMDD